MVEFDDDNDDDEDGNGDVDDDNDNDDDGDNDDDVMSSHQSLCTARQASMVTPERCGGDCGTVSGR